MWLDNCRRILFNSEQSLHRSTSCFNPSIAIQKYCYCAAVVNICNSSVDVVVNVDNIKVLDRGQMAYCFSYTGVTAHSNYRVLHS